MEERSIPLARIAQAPGPASPPWRGVTKRPGNTPSVALPQYVHPAEAAYALVLHWRAEVLDERPDAQTHAGAKRSALEAQKAAQQATAENCMATQTSPQTLESCGVMQDVAEHNILLQHGLRKCMGIEPTDRTVHARPSGFEDRGHHQVCRHFPIAAVRPNQGRFPAARDP